MEKTESPITVNSINPLVHLMVALFLFYSANVITTPFLMDILLEAFCPGGGECRHVLFLMGAHSTLAGLGAVVMAPILGSLSDDYGRKPVFMIVFVAAIVPSVLLASNTSTVAVIMWFVLLCASHILRDGGLIPCALAYVADVVDERHRSSAVGLTMASVSIGYVAGTGSAFFITSQFVDLWASAALQIAAAVFVYVLVQETNRRTLPLPSEQSHSEIKTMLIPKPTLRSQTSNFIETAKTTTNSLLLRPLAMVDFMNSFGATAYRTFLLYYLKVAFHFGKDEYAELVLLNSLTAGFGQMLFYPLLAHLIGERGVLWIGLIGASGQYFLIGFAWATWVTYLAAGMGIFVSFIEPAIGTLVSKGAEHENQGKVQGFMGGVRSAAVILCPMLLTSLTAVFLGDNPPFNMPGLPFVIAGVVLVVACLISFGLTPPPIREDTFKPNNHTQVHEEDSKSAPPFPKNNQIW